MTASLEPVTGWRYWLTGYHPGLGRSALMEPYAYPDQPGGNTHAILTGPDDPGWTARCRYSNHPAPDPDCACGLRVLTDLTELVAFMLPFAADPLFNRQVAIGRVQSVGPHLGPGNVDDPPSTRRCAAVHLIGPLLLSPNSAPGADDYRQQFRLDVHTADTDSYRDWLTSASPALDRGLSVGLDSVSGMELQTDEMKALRDKLVDEGRGAYAPKSVLMALSTFATAEDLGLVSCQRSDKGDAWHVLALTADAIIHVSATREGDGDWDLGSHRDTGAEVTAKMWSRREVARLEAGTPDVMNEEFSNDWRWSQSARIVMRDGTSVPVVNEGRTHNPQIAEVVDAAMKALRGR